MIYPWTISSCVKWRCWLLPLTLFGLSISGSGQRELVSQETLPHQVIVGLHDEATLEDAFAFINHYQLDVQCIGSLSYGAKSSSQKLVDLLNHEMENLKFVEKSFRIGPAMLGEYDGKVRLSVRLNHIDCMDYQDRWLEFCEEYKLQLNGIHGYITFIVPEGHEDYWVERFSSLTIVKYATRATIRHYRKKIPQLGKQPISRYGK